MPTPAAAATVTKLPDRTPPTRRECQILRRDLREARKALGYTYKDVALATGFYTNSMLCKIERGRARVLSRRGYDSVRRWLDATLTAKAS